MRPSRIKTTNSKGTSRSCSKDSQSSNNKNVKKSFLKCSSSKIEMANSFIENMSSIIKSPKQSIKHYASNSNIKSPTIKTLKPIDTQNQLRKFGKQIVMNQPQLIKKRNDNINHLQTKLKALQSQITHLKTNISVTNDHINKIRKSRSKSKQSKGSSINSKSQMKLNSFQMPSSFTKKKQVYSPRLLKKQQIKQRSKRLQTQPNRKKPSESETTTNSKVIANQQQQIQIMDYYSDYQSKIFQQHISQSITILNFMKKITKPKLKQLKSKMIILPKIEQNRKTLIFDLDQTLIHCPKINQNCDIRIPVQFPNGMVIKAGINIRNYTKQLLTNLSKKFQIIVFTASHSCYANSILNELDPKGVIISHRFFRQNCYQAQQNLHVKDLRIFQNRDLKNIVLIDNAAYSYSFQIDNGIPIIPFYNSKQDVQLRSLQKFLLQMILPAQDVREVLKQRFKLNRYQQFSKHQTLIEQLYKK